MSAQMHSLLAALAACALGAHAAAPSLAPAKETLNATHTCALTAEGRVFCWGHNASDQLGQGASTTDTGPGRVTGITSPVISIAAGSSHACVVTAVGSVQCWGSNEWGQLGNGATADSSSPSQVAGFGGGIVAVTAGSNSSCALSASGAVQCWGFPGVRSPRPVLGLSSGVVAIATGGGIFWTQSCAVTSAGAVVCWSGNDGATATAEVPGLSSGMVAVAVGSNHACALSSQGAVLCWGQNFKGQLGNGTTADSKTPVQAAGLSSGVRAITARLDRTCALMTSGAVQCWGDGNSTATSSSVPVLVPGLSSIVAITTGSTWSCALNSAGKILCWGGTFPGGFSVPPVSYSGFTGTYTSISAGGGFLCALTSTNAVECAGANASGQLGRGGTLTGTTTPLSLATLAPGVKSIAAGSNHTCVITAAGGAKCWGQNSQGALGDGINFSHATPTDVPGMTSGLKAITAGIAHTCALSEAGGVFCWGTNNYGELGNGSRASSRVAVPVVGLSSGVVSISAGFFHTCAILADFSAQCWGANHDGQLGDGTPNETLVPVPVRGVPGSIARISPGTQRTCAVTRTGAAYCWGSNAIGMLGNGGGSTSLVPVAVAGLSAGVTEIASAYWHTCAIAARGAVYCWGDHYGNVPKPLPDLASGASGIFAGAFNTCAATADGIALCWGSNREGELGDGTYVNRPMPVVVRREGGLGSIAANDWFLDLDPSIPKAVPAERTPPFLLAASASGGTVMANIQYRAQDVGTTGSVYVFAIAPADLLKDAFIPKDAYVRMYAKGGPKESAPVQCVLAQLTASGRLAPVSVSALQAYITDVFKLQGQAVQIVSGVATVNIAGATFYVGYGTNATAMINGGVNRSAITVPATQVCKPQAPQTGWWWNPAEDGRGFSIEVRGKNIFFAAFLYDVSGRATWYVATGETSLDGSYYSGPLYSARGGQALGGAYPGRPILKDEGPITVTFNDSSAGTLVWPGGAVPIQRFSIVPNGLNLPPAANQPESGWWWNEEENGRGFFMEWQGGTLDLAGYMYDEAGNPVWYLTVDSMKGATGQSFSNTWWSYGNGQTLTGAWKPNARLNSNVAPVTIEFSSPSTAIMTLPNGRTTALKRHRF